MKKSYFRPVIDAMAGYVPGEQPKIDKLIKVNTNENPYPPAPGVFDTLRAFAANKLRLYPQPTADIARETIATLHGVGIDNVIAANGSDDTLNIAIRSFCGPGLPLACFNPSYSLYPVLAQMQEAPIIRINLAEGFRMPSDTAEQAAPANLLIITRPNAPTGNAFPMAEVRALIENFDGVVLVDEAYADFSDDNCMDLVREYDNLIVSRTMSKSYSLAGIRFGYAVACPELIEGMMKVKDSYNVDMLTQYIVRAALSDQEYLDKTRSAILATRARMERELAKLGFKYVPSQTNFLFATPPDNDGKRFFDVLRENAILVRYFPGEVTGRYVRISVGSDAEIDKLLEVAARLYS